MPMPYALCPMPYAEGLVELNPANRNQMQHYESDPNPDHFLPLTIHPNPNITLTIASHQGVSDLTLSLTLALT